MSHALPSQTFRHYNTPAFVTVLRELFTATPLYIFTTALAEALRLARTRKY